MRRDRHNGADCASLAWRRCVRLMRKTDPGAATAEFAIVLPAIVVSAILLLVLARAGTVAMTCQDAASAAMRSAVISKNDGKARLAAHRVAGPSVGVAISRGGGQVSVTVSCPIASKPLPMNVLPGSVKGKAVGAEQ